jgi:hypothetical protein
VLLLFAGKKKCGARRVRKIKYRIEYRNRIKPKISFMFAFSLGTFPSSTEQGERKESQAAKPGEIKWH